MRDPRPGLERERRQVQARLEGLRADHDEVVAASRDTNADDEHDPEGATIAFERSQVAALARQARARLAEVEDALARADADTYGTCESCSLPIDPARLEARPTSAQCISCASDAARRLRR